MGTTLQGELKIWGHLLKFPHNNAAVLDLTGDPHCIVSSFVPLYPANSLKKASNLQKTSSITQQGVTKKSSTNNQEFLSLTPFLPKLPVYHY